MQWQGEQYLQQMEDLVGNRLEAAAIHLVNEARQILSVAGRTIAYREITRGKNRGQTRRVIGKLGSNPSRPGEPPHKQTGFLRSSVNHEVDRANLVARVGSTVKYAKFLELGTRKMAARPWLRRTLAENHEPIRRIIERGDVQ